MSALNLDGLSFGKVTGQDVGLEAEARHAGITSCERNAVDSLTWERANGRTNSMPP